MECRREAGHPSLDTLGDDYRGDTTPPVLECDGCGCEVEIGFYGNADGSRCFNGCGGTLREVQ
jgi:hypothetical protein